MKKIGKGSIHVKNEVTVRVKYIIMDDFFRNKFVKFYENKDKEIPENKIFDSMNGIIEFLVKDAPKDTVCLLSCASPSYSIFKNYIEKGTLFQEEIKKWVNGKN